VSVTRDADTVVVYADYVCPFCYLGRRSLDEYRAGRAESLTVEWHPFDLRGQKRGEDGQIDHSVDDGKDEKYFEDVRQSVERLRERYGAGAMLGIDDIPEVDSLPAQAASLSVAESNPDEWESFDEAVFEALWVDGRAIDDPAVLADLAGSVGLDGEAVGDAAPDEQRHRRVFEQFEEARNAGITGVPTFVADGHAARGAVPPEQLQRLIEG
jgi:predicted DsbA family dithiol-disulfide isomerase